ncbi:L-type lectin family protein [Companilactobacillus hulinensis]|uniref:lectin-like domain-containing protein n=1 Tax=Companilactobacillus hulinensis TaxID=2486007 RepID=UPI000F7921AC|nr:hypothetical protein [Companilactobacillus hulinensis]
MRFYWYLLGISLTIILVGIIALNNNVQMVEAAAPVPTPNQVLQSAPRGLDISDYFEMPAYYPGAEGNVTNTAKILRRGQGVPTDMIEMTDGKINSELASFWGKMQADDGSNYNYFDVTKPQTFSMWLYLGDQFPNDSDGMAFVIQNSDDGMNAISRYSGVGSWGFGTKSYPQGGETMGVWGGSNNTSIVPDVNTLAKGAIQKSFALEFDTDHNDKQAYSNLLGFFGSYTRDNFLDATLNNNNVFEAKGQHIAWNYPGNFHTYERHMGTVYVSYAMHHNGAIPNLTLSGNLDVKNAWHHVTFKYYPPTDSSNNAHFDYVYDDKNYDGSLRASKYVRSVKSQTLNLDEFHLAKGATKLRWGFTGSSSTQLKTSGVIFESIPALSSISNTSNLYDITQERDIPDLDKDEHADANVNNGDQLRFEYDLNYQSGWMTSGAIDNNIVLPRFVDFTGDKSGVIGHIFYPNKTVDIPVSSIKDGSIHLQLESMDPSNDKIKIQLNGQANIGNSATAEKQTIAPEHASFDSVRYRGDSMSYQFVINPVTDKLKIDSATDEVQKTSLNKSIDFKGKIGYEKKSAFGDTKITLHTLIDGVEQEQTDETVNADATEYEFSLPIAAEEIGLGKHTVEIFASDSKHRVSESVKYDVDISDYKKLKLDSDNTDITALRYKDSYLTGEIWYDDNSLYTKDELTLYGSIDGGKWVSEKLTGSDLKASNEFTEKLLSDTLSVGVHNIRIYAQDKYRKSDILTYKITVISDYLKLDYDEAYAFQTVNQGTTLVPRSGNWNLKVESTNTVWNLKVQSSPMLNDITSLPLNGEMIYRTDYDEKSLENGPVMIGSGKEPTAEDSITDITKNWLPNTGVLLKIRPNVTAGKYTATMKWSLGNTPA